MSHVYPKASAFEAAGSGVTASPKFPALEEAVLDYWKKDNTFSASVENRPAGENGENEFVFYDGPPFANGLPHYGHLLTGYAKDLVARYQTQRGHKVERRFGWDTHGLPAELEAMKQLGMTDKREILEMGIDNFNDAARASVLKYTNEWEKYVTRQARWVDFENDYKTLNVEYMESVIWAFKRLYDKGLTYQGFRVLPYCWKDETPLSNHELRMDDDVYKDRQDQTVTVAFRLTADTALGADEKVAAELDGVEALAWTTTPWTLPTNQALAVGPEIEYSVVPGAGKFEGRSFLIASDLLGSYAKDLGYEGDQPEKDAAAAVTARYTGSQLEHVRYTPLWDYFADTEKWGTETSWQILVADYVTTGDGTGIVHQAPAYGEDDQKVCEGYGIPVILSLDEGAKFLNLFAEPTASGTTALAEIAGVQAFDANRTIINALKADDVLIREKSYVHSYPHCWRCRKPLMYKAVSSWFVRVTQIRDRMVELNQEITWTPAHTKDGIFGKWLEGARDWSISRNRFWGAPIPVWVSDDPAYPRTDVYGSIAELEADFGVKVTDFHRPFIDSLTRPNPDDPTGKSTMRRISDVFDCWFESGSMPFAQVHYPFENQEWFENHYPGDFIVEYIGQTRGWFYTLHVLATALFDRPAFRSCVSHGIVLGDDGLKMSKSLRNYPDVAEVFNKYGSDAMRWFLMSSPVVRGGNLIVKEESIRDTVRQVLLPIWNTYYFFTLYAGACNKGEGYEAKRIDLSSPEAVAALAQMDRYLLAHTRTLAEDVRGALDAYDVAGACEAVRDYLDVLTNWYVRTQRQRFWDEDSAAFDTLYTALVTLMELAAPLLPLLSEEIWRGLTGGESVHLTDFPVIDEAVDAPELVAAMDEVRSIVSAAHALRKTHQLRVRQPLASLQVVSEHFAALEPFADLIASEVNVKSVVFSAPENSGLSVRTELSLNPRAFDPAVRKLTSQLFKAQKSGEWEVVDGQCRFASVELDGAPLVLTGDMFSVSTSVDAAEGQVADVLASGTFVVLDTELTPELEAEGYARDVVRAVQDERKNAGLHIADRIDLSLTVPSDHVADVETWRDMIAAETLALSLTVEADDKLAVSVAKH